MASLDSWYEKPLGMCVQLKRERDHRAALQQELEALKRGLGRRRTAMPSAHPHQSAEAAPSSPPQ